MTSELIYILAIVVLSVFIPVLLILSRYNLFERMYIDQQSLPVSIIVAAKNESANAEGLVMSLYNLDYPEDKYEVIIIDDNSTDDTFDKLKSLTAAKNNFRVIKAKNKIYEGKRGALDAGIKTSRFDLIAVTDADCRPEEMWLQEISRLFSDGKDFIIGPAVFNKKHGIFSGLACYENFRNQLMMQGFAYSGFPYAGSAGNFAFQKSAFNEVGGFTGTEHSLSGDDDLLIQKFNKAEKKAGLVSSTEAKVFTNHAENFNVYLKQKRRHVSASHHYSLRDKIALGLINIANISLTIFLFIGLFSGEPVFLSAGVIKAAAYIFLAKTKGSLFNYRFGVFEAFLYDTVYEFFQVYNFISSLFSKPQWK